MSKEIIFDHKSLQDRKSIKKYLKVITEGLAKGVITFNDGISQTTLEPNGLVSLHVTVTGERGHKELSLSLDWEDADTEEMSEPHTLLISSEGNAG